MCPSLEQKDIIALPLFKRELPGFFGDVFNPTYRLAEETLFVDGQRFCWSWTIDLRTYDEAPVAICPVFCIPGVCSKWMGTIEPAGGRTTTCTFLYTQVR